MFRFSVVLLLILFGRCSLASAQCTPPLPRSEADIYGFYPARIDVVKLPDPEFRQLGQQLDGGDPHVVEVVASMASGFAIEDEVIVRQDAGFCDAPHLVRVGLGFDRQTIYVSLDSADDPCLAAALEARGVELAAGVNLAPERFVNDRTEFIQKSLSLLKHTAAPAEAVAKEYWRAGLRQIMQSLRTDFDAEVGHSRGVAASDATLRKAVAACAATAQHT